MPAQAVPGASEITSDTHVTRTTRGNRNRSGPNYRSVIQVGHARPRSRASRQVDPDRLPRPPDREREATGRLDVDEQRVPVRAEGGAGELVVGNGPHRCCCGAGSAQCGRISALLFERPRTKLSFTLSSHTTRVPCREVVMEAGLMVRSFIAMQRADLGIKPENVLAMQISLPPR